MNIDMHTHTFYSHDGISSPEAMIDAAIAKGLHGFAVTDHDTLEAHGRAKAYANAKGFVVIPGCEISSAGGHIIALWQSEFIRPGLSVEETIDKIKEQGAVVVIPHPFSPYKKVAVERKIDYKNVDAIEVFNGRQPRAYDRKCFSLAMELKKPVTSGSDAHSVKEIGHTFTYFDATNEEELRRAILKGVPHKTKTIPPQVLAGTYATRFGRILMRSVRS